MQHFDSLIEVFDWMIKQGFTEEFSLKEKGLWHSKSKKMFPNVKINIIHTIKIEGDSDPDYTSYVFAAEIKGTGLKGYFVDACGSYAILEFSNTKE